ncbi:MAG: DedA family protein [Cyanobacteria bacterium P01_A01_bin.114]
MDILDHITTAIALFGYWGIAFLMLLENVIPPIPSEIIMPLAGFAVARGEMTMLGAITAGTVGSVLGALVWYYIGKLLGLKRICKLANRYGRWLGVSGKEVMSVQTWFANRSGYWAVGLGRLLPSIRTYISVPAGVAKMPFGKFLLASTLGTIGWITLLTLAGFWLGESYDQVAAFLAPVGKVIPIILGILVAGWILYRWKKHRSDTSS